MRKLIYTALAILLGPVFGALGSLVAVWVWLAVYRPERAVDLARWMEANTPLDLTVPPGQRIDNPESLCLTGAFAAFLLAIAFGMLRFVRRSFGPPNMSDDDRAQIRLTTIQPRVGRPLEGSLRLMKKPKPAETFRVSLGCRRDHDTTDMNGRHETRVEMAFAASLEAPVIHDDQGWTVVFRFEVPVVAPPSQGNGGFQWQLGLRSTRSWNASTSVFDLKLAPAPPEEVAAVEAAETPAQKELIAETERTSFQRLLPHERAQIQTLSPEEVATRTAQTRMVRAGMGSCLKWVLILFVGVPLALILVIYIVGQLMVRNR